ncbi:uncharacterized protein [Branchiostoma lanceolatum]|uniref:uncharacterized protein n=1 Tax=Branchiostoma lanceolatum TaxID=7740 RepID=UPI003453F8CA
MRTMRWALLVLLATIACTAAGDVLSDIDKNAIDVEDQLLDREDALEGELTETDEDELVDEGQRGLFDHDHEERQFSGGGTSGGGGGAKYISLGCWKDSSNRAIPTLEKTDARLDGSYRARANAIEKCYQVR